MNINEKYFDWMCKYIFHKKSGRRYIQYSNVMKQLYNTEFLWQTDLDSNRADDGIGLRYRFGFSQNYYPDFIQENIDNRPCSILEMMVALSIRCEEEITGDQTDLRPDKIFWLMMDTSGLSEMKNTDYNPVATQDIIDRLLLKEYGPFGEGGWFPVTTNGDIRIFDIWWQLNLYITEYMRKKGEI